MFAALDVPQDERFLAVETVQALLARVRPDKLEKAVKEMRGELVHMQRSLMDAQDSKAAELKLKDEQMSEMRQGQLVLLRYSLACPFDADSGCGMQSCLRCRIR